MIFCVLIYTFTSGHYPESGKYVNKLLIFKLLAQKNPKNCTKELLLVHHQATDCKFSISRIWSYKSAAYCIWDVHNVQKQPVDASREQHPAVDTSATSTVQRETRRDKPRLVHACNSEHENWPWTSVKEVNVKSQSSASLLHAKPFQPTLTPHTPLHCINVIKRPYLFYNYW